MTTAAVTIADAFDAGRLALTVLDDGSGVLLDQDAEALISLNATGLVLVEALKAGCRDEGQLADRLVERFRVDRPRAEADVTAFLRALADSL
ncbi:PqqD family protein [Wenzhouxiangella marina]|uniref:Uncharacterized protein n=1 Tax=Wenzhouxiangella marina TaxID=1579979 RepID=A0A0K0XY01_9GAMM|nr:PqqD family protein [Wenzhouxiangella marina]AKS42512.1 hypothetical protein WM2015_2148 [Wenzhouxiangella marina]MBB6085712.1 hypothetical protein [Wenzhouxiangella marina]